MYDKITQRVRQFLDNASEAYYEGTPLISDEVFDNLAHNYNYNRVGYISKNNNKLPHTFRMYSLHKIYDDEAFPIDLKHELVESYKLDGAAVEFTYEFGNLVLAVTRGDGIEGEVITYLFTDDNVVPQYIAGSMPLIQVTGEIVAKSDVPNSRNYASGALHLKDKKEFDTREVYFVAYGLETGQILDTYQGDMYFLSEAGFNTVLDNEFCKQFKHDGTVYRVNSNRVFKEMGYTAKHPRGAFARKLSSDVETKPTELLEVIWQNGAGGKLTPVAVFEEVEIDSAKINRATLHNAGFVENLDLHIGDTLLVTKKGGIIPGIVGKL